MAEAGGAFVTRSFERMLKEASGKKYINLQNALKAYLDRRPTATPVPPTGQTEEAISSHDNLGTEGVKTEEDILPPNKTEAHVQTGNSLVPLRQSTGQAAAATMTEAETNFLWTLGRRSWSNWGQKRSHAHGAFQHGLQII